MSASLYLGACTATLSLAPALFAGLGKKNHALEGPTVVEGQGVLLPFSWLNQSANTAKKSADAKTSVEPETTTNAQPHNESHIRLDLTLTPPSTPTNAATTHHKALGKQFFKKIKLLNRHFRRNAVWF